MINDISTIQSKNVTIVKYNSQPSKEESVQSNIFGENIEHSFLNNLVDAASLGKVHLIRILFYY